MEKKEPTYKLHKTETSSVCEWDSSAGQWVVVASVNVTRQKNRASQPQVVTRAIKVFDLDINKAISKAALTLNQMIIEDLNLLHEQEEESPSVQGEAKEWTQ